MSPIVAKGPDRYMSAILRQDLADDWGNVRDIKKWWGSLPPSTQDEFLRRYPGSNDGEFPWTPKKVLFVEEIQSDWHQKGRQVGYQVESSKLLEELKKFGLSPDMTITPNIEVWKSLGIPDNVIDRLRPQYEALLKQNPESVPDAPF